MGGGFILRSGALTAVQCLQYAINLPTSVVITGCDSMPVLDQALHTARSFQPLSKEQVAAILNSTAQYAGAGKYEKYKSTELFDGTTHHPDWMG